MNAAPGFEIDELFAIKALKRGLVTPDQLVACWEGQKAIEAVGRRPSLAALLVDRRDLAPAQAEAIRTEIQGKGAYPGFGGYELHALLGRGGMGAVYRARHVTLDRIVAIKLLPPPLAFDKSYIDRFLREARIAAKLRHPNLVEVYDAGQAEDIYFLAMEFVDGHSVADALESQGPFREDRVLKLGWGVARALAAAQQFSIVHRDIKPGNILLTPTDQVKLADMGLAKQTLRADSFFSTQGGLVAGTVAYMSPEQSAGEPNLDVRSDIYSLGITLFETATGRRPFTGRTKLEIAQQRMAGPVDPRRLSPTVSPGLATLIMQMTFPKPENRPRTALALLQLVEEEIGRRAGTHKRPLPPPPPSPVPIARARQAMPTPPPQPPPQRMPTPPVTQTPVRPRPARSPAMAIGLSAAGVGLVAVLALGLALVGRGPSTRPASHEEILIPAGEFHIGPWDGSALGRAAEKYGKAAARVLDDLGRQAPRRVALPAFRIGRREVTNREYQKFLEAAEKSPKSPTRSDTPKRHPTTATNQGSGRMRGSTSPASP